MRELIVWLTKVESCCLYAPVSCVPEGRHGSNDQDKTRRNGLTGKENVQVQ